MGVAVDAELVVEVAVDVVEVHSSCLTWLTTSPWMLLWACDEDDPHEPQRHSQQLTHEAVCVVEGTPVTCRSACPNSYR